MSRSLEFEQFIFVVPVGKQKIAELDCITHTNTGTRLEQEKKKNIEFSFSCGTICKTI